MENKIKLTEDELNKIIKESVKQVLNEVQHLSIADYQLLSGIEKTIKDIVEVVRDEIIEHLGKEMDTNKELYNKIIEIFKYQRIVLEQKVLSPLWIRICEGH